jgi:hypothetical protein
MLVVDDKLQNISPIQGKMLEGKRESKDQMQIIDNLNEKLNQVSHALTDQQEEFK